MKRSRIDRFIMAQEGLTLLDRATLEALQLAKLNAVLARMRAHGASYLPPQIAQLADLATLPFTTAADLAAQPGRFLLTSQGEVARIITDQTSGTTAAAKRVFYTAEDVQHTIDFFAAGISEMAQSGETVLITMPFSGAMGLGDLIQQAVKKIGARSLCAGYGKSYAALAALVRTHKPSCYIGFPVPLLSLARYLGAACSIRRALISGDVCPPGVFAQLAERFQLYPHYGSRELCLGGAITCPAFAGMHLRENHFIAEIIDDDGQPLPAGATGELVITTIGMTAMPIIRYRTGDRTHILAAPCPCGSVTRRIAQPVRMGQDAALQYALDDALFALPQVIDTCVRQCGDTLHIQALCTQPDCADVLRHAAQTVRPAVQVDCRRCTGSDTPLYAGKRKLIKEETLCQQQ